MRALAILVVLLAACAAPPTQPTADELASLAPTGKLRVGVYPGSPTSMVRDAATGEVKGVAVDLGAELARRLGVPAERVEFRTAADVVDGMKAGRVDFLVTNGTPARAQIVDFTQPILAIESGYLVPAGSPIRSFADLDKPGVRIGVLQGSTSQSILPARLHEAAIVPMPSIKAAVDMLASGKLDAYATNKGILFEMSDSLPGSRVLDGRWGLEEIAIGIPKGRAAGLEYARKFAAEAIAQGLVARAAQRAGVRGMAE